MTPNGYQEVKNRTELKRNKVNNVKPKPASAKKGDTKPTKADQWQ